MVRRATWLFLALACVGVSAPANANQYNANDVMGKITGVKTYTYTPMILFTVEIPPSLSCQNGKIFELPASLPDNVRQSVLSRLLLAYSTGEAINIGYDAQTCSPNGYIWVGRVG